MPKEIKKNKTTTKSTAKKLTATAKKPVSKNKKTLISETVTKKTTGLSKQKTTNLIKKIKLAEKTESAENLFKKTKGPEVDLSKIIDKKTKKEELKDKNDLVILPSKIDLRLLEKVRKYQNFISDQSEEVVIRVAIVGGYVFIFSGLLFSLLTINAINNQALKANTLVSLCEKEENCFDTSGTTLDKINLLQKEKTTESLLAATNQEEPTINFLNQPTLPLLEDFPLQATIKFIENPILILTSETSGGEITIQNSEKDNDTYTFVLPKAVLQNDNFIVTVKATTVSSKNEVLFRGVPLLFKNTDLENKNNEESDESETDKKKENDSEVENLNENITQEKTEILAEDNEEEENKEDKEEDKNLKTTENTSQNLSDNSLKTTFISETKTLKLSLTAEEAKKVEIYAQNKSTQTPIFLGLATKLNSDWLFFIKENTLPAGSYFVFAKIENNSEVARTPFTSIIINHENLSSGQNSPTEENTDIIILNEKIKKVFASEGDNEQVLLRRQNYFSNFAVDLKEVGKTESNKSLNDQINIFLQEQEFNLNKIFSRYGSVFLIQNPAFLPLVKKHQQEAVNFLAEEFVKKHNLTTLDAIESNYIIQEKLTYLKNKVEEYEQDLKNRSDLIAKDSDKDGISDFDEVNIYNTNPFHPDSDGDSFLDGAEVAQNFNPLKSISEVNFTTEDPERVAVRDIFNLKINQITPVTHINNEVGLSQTFLRFEGEGLSNSFLTLTTKNSLQTFTSFVKTDASGNFSFILTKDLVSGEYKSYLSLTENSGRIIDQSEVFEFSKTGAKIENKQNFTALSLTTKSSSKPELSYSSSTASMGVVSLGIILLTIGKVLFREREDEIKEISIQKNLKAGKK